VRRDPLGKLLLERGAIPDSRALEDVLSRQAQPLPIASLCYVLGYAPERPLVAALAASRGFAGVVLDESVIRLEVLGSLARETAMRIRILPIFEDSDRLVLAAADPEAAAGAAGELERVRDRRVEVVIALEVTLARTIRACYLGRSRGDLYWLGTEAVADAAAHGGSMALVALDDPEGGRIDDTARAHRALINDITKEIQVGDLFLDDDFERARTATPSRTNPRAAPAPPDPLAEISGESSLGPSTPTPHTDAGSGIDTPWPPGNTDVDDAETMHLIAELDAVSPPRHDGPPRVLIVDDDFATRHFLVKELQPLGYQTSTAPSGGEALRAIRQATPDLVVCDIMLPEIDGFRLCRAIKRCRPLAQVPVILMSAVIDSGRVTDDVLARYDADAYLEKPLDTRRVHRVVRELLGRRRGKSVSGEAGFLRAIDLYQGGDIDGAIGVLRGAVDADPSSAKYRFVLANLLQRRDHVIEAIDEYETVVQLEPSYFPALTRLAYLYYQQGLVARAVDTWRRSLPLCVDPGLRRNIELFMRKLIAEMGALT
jgi:DNA-binding response OmpR family regulator